VDKQQAAQHAQAAAETQARQNTETLGTPHEHKQNPTDGRWEVRNVDHGGEFWPPHVWEPKQSEDDPEQWAVVETDPDGTVFLHVAPGVRYRVAQY
jgi:hypothetical protein